MREEYCACHRPPRVELVMGWERANNDCPVTASEGCEGGTRRSPAGPHGADRGDRGPSWARGGGSSVNGYVMRATSWSFLTGTSAETRIVSCPEAGATSS